MIPAPPVQYWACHYHEDCYEQDKVWHLGVTIVLPHDSLVWWKNSEKTECPGQAALEEVVAMFPLLRARLWDRFGHYVRLRQACPEFPTLVWNRLFIGRDGRRNTPSLVTTLEDLLSLTQRDMQTSRNIGPVIMRYVIQAQERLKSTSFSLLPSAWPEWDEWAASFSHGSHAIF